MKLAPINETFEKKDDFELTLRNAITWFDELVRLEGAQCGTSTFIHNILCEVLAGMPTDGAMLWDQEIFERNYPITCSKIRQEEREKILGIIRYQVPDFINRRLKDGK